MVKTRDRSTFLDKTLLIKLTAMRARQNHRRHPMRKLPKIIFRAPNIRLTQEHIMTMIVATSIDVITATMPETQPMLP